MIKPHVKVKEHYARGLGWEVISDLPGDEYALTHSDSDAGVKTRFVLLPKMQTRHGNPDKRGQWSTCL
jgi:hypothetical protein